MYLSIYSYLSSTSILAIVHPGNCQLPWNSIFYFLFLLKKPSLGTISTCFQSFLKCFFFESHCHIFAAVTPFLPHNHVLYHFIFTFTLIAFHLQILNQFLPLVRVKSIVNPKMLKMHESGPQNLYDCYGKESFSFFTFAFCLFSP